MKNLLFSIVICFSYGYGIANMPAPEYWDENNLDIIIKGHSQFPDYTFYCLIRSEGEEWEEAEALQPDEHYLRLSHLKEQKVFLWAEQNENGLPTDTILISASEQEDIDDHFLLISGIKDNNIQFERDFDKIATPVRYEYPGGNNKQVLIIISFSGILLLSLLAYLLRKRKSRSSYA